MNVLTINQTIDLITSHMDEIRPQKASAKLYAELKHLRELKMKHPKGGLLPYSGSQQIKTKIESKNNFGFIQNFNRATSFTHNRIKEFAL